ncbi:MAG: LL-diaminopimelate aminotransferase [Leptolyngbyaceae cyanobacterium]
MQLADRIQPLQTNVFAEMDQAKATARAKGRDLIDLSLGSSDLPTDPVVLEAIAQSLQDPSTHGYLLFNGTQAFREAIAQWYERKFGLAVDPDTEVMPLIGSQEGTGHLPLAVLNPGDVALLQDPGYPSHAGGVYLASGKIHLMPLLAKHQFFPQFDAIPADILAQARLMVLSYPHNPTTATATVDFFEEAIAFCQRHNLVLAHDFPYGDFMFDGSIAPSVLQADRQKTCSIEFFTMSKSYNMGGFRVGYAIGNADLIRALRQLKSYIDFNQYRGILKGAIVALASDRTPQKTVATFKQRRDAFVKILHDMGWMIDIPTSTMYIWAKLPDPWSHDSIRFCTDLVEATGVAAAPGAGFGPSGEGYIRLALVHPPETLAIAATRIAKFLQST